MVSDGGAKIADWERELLARQHAAGDLETHWLVEHLDQRHRELRGLFDELDGLVARLTQENTRPSTLVAEDFRLQMPPIQECIAAGHSTDGEHCRYGFCGRCGRHLDNDTQGHYWKHCKITKQTEEFHFCCPGDCQLSTRREEQARVENTRLLGEIEVLRVINARALDVANLERDVIEKAQEQRAARIAVAALVKRPFAAELDAAIKRRERADEAFDRAVDALTQPAEEVP